MRNLRGTVLIAWVFCAVVSGATIINAASIMASRWSIALAPGQANGVLFTLLPVLYAIPASLIVSRHPRNIIGWLLMTFPLVTLLSDSMQRYLEGFQAAPPPATLPIFFIITLINISWLALIMPLLMIPLFFPTGRLLSPHWRWALFLAAGMCVFLFLWGMATVSYQPDFASWTLYNPSGFLSGEDFNYVMPVWGMLLAVLTVASLSSIVIRYRQATTVEREQMKWLLFASALFGLVFIPSLYFAIENSPTVLGVLFNILFPLAIAFIPISITIAVLRYHLFDIDVIIRLTLVYAILSALLGLAYAAGIILVQAGFRKLTGQTNDIGILITTLAIASLANPVRRRIQAIIDQRFYRQKYNIDHALAEFASAARGGSQLEDLTSMLVDLVAKTLQPTQVNLLLKTGDGEKKAPGKDHPGA